MPEIIKVRDGKYLVPIEVTPRNGRLYLKFAYNVRIKDEIKVMQGARWDPDSKQWHISLNQRNLFAIQFLAGGNPYARWEAPLVQFTPRRSYLMEHQKEMAAFAMTRHYGVFACEMGTGKTLTMIEVIEQSGTKDWWWIGPRNAIFSVKNEFKKWAICGSCGKTRKKIYLGATTLEPCTCPAFIDTSVLPLFLSYEELKKRIDSWPGDTPPPQAVCFDESSRLKNPTAQRTVAAQILTNDIRDHWGSEGFAIEMSGSPAPKDPCDWHSQCEIAQPGFLREGDIHKFRKRLCVIEQKENTITGGTYPHLVTWLDNPKKCTLCGNEKDHPSHNLQLGGHTWTESRDEVSFLYKRMNGLVLVKLKKDCLNLPEKIYEVIELDPPNEMKRAASIIQAKCPTTIQCLTLLRELSDGFQYEDEDVGQTQTCPRCSGSKVEETFDYCGPDEEYDATMLAQSLGQQTNPAYFAKHEQTCDYCSGTGEVARMVRKSREVTTPKEGALKAST